MDPERLGTRKILILEYLASIINNSTEKKKCESNILKEMSESDLAQYKNLSHQGKMK